MNMLFRLKKLVRKLALTISLVISIVTPGAPYADDTEVFLGVTTSTVGVKPNVLFILDTSGSMGWAVGGGDRTIRMVAMKEAMTEILSSANNLNVGLMTFNGIGGPVRLPVRDIDAPLNIDEGYQVVRSIVQSTDDAQEVDDLSSVENGTMDLTNQFAYLSQGPAVSASTTTINIPIAVANDEIDENIISGTQQPNDSSFLINSSFLTGLRFQNVSVPQGADVINATLRMRAFYNSSSAATTIKIAGQASDNSGSLLGTGQVNNLYTTQATANVHTWMLSGFVQNQDVYTNNIQHIIDEIVGRPGWLSDNALTLFLESSGGEFYGYAPYYGSHTAAQSPELEIEYIANASAGAARRTTGLRFDDVRIPQGATITEAYISVKSASDSNEKIQFHIHSELSDDSATYTTSDGNITGRPISGNYTLWDLKDTDQWLSGERYFSPDISNVVQRVVDRNNWCGGNAMSIVLRNAQSVDARHFYTFDGAPNISNDVPTLHVKYDLSGIAPSETGCTLRLITKRIEASEDDVEERQDNRRVQANSSDLDVGDRIVGLRFNGIQLPQGANILSANIEFTANSNRNDAAGAIIYGENIDNAPVYTGSAKGQVSGRISSRPTSSVVPWNNIVNSTFNQSYLTPDLTAMVTEIVNRPGWLSGNSMGFMLDPTTNRREYYTFNGDAARAPRLIIEAQVNLTASSVEGETVRDQLISEVNSLIPNGGTPITDTLYEGIQYYRGTAVDLAKTRNYGSWWGRVSHPDSYENGTGVYRHPDCTDSNLNHASCWSERINGPANYISPIDNACQANYIVLLTDGTQNNFFGQSKIRSLTGTTCSGDTSNSDSNCGFALAEYAHTADLSTNEIGSSNLPGDQHVTIYTIGFTKGSNPDYMEGLATRGGGQHFSANNASQLVDVFQQITQDILSKPATFTAPSLTVNAFNQIYNTSDVYVSLFEPSLNSRWAGNIKKYNLCTDVNGVVFICDANKVSITNPSTKAIKDTAVSLWDTIDDGPVIKLGGAGSQLQTPGSRRLFTYTGVGSPSNVDLGLTVHELSKGNGGLTPALLGVASNADKEHLIDWIRGIDTEGENDGPHPNSRWAYADALHSAVVTVTYGGTASNQIDKLLVGTNDGFIRMVNGYNGLEEWAFMPQQLLQIQNQMQTNAQVDRIYGVDGDPILWRYDADGDAQIEKSDGDFIKAYIGMRRGGNSYFALNITPDTAIANAAAANTITPQLMWRIDGGVGDFARLGQTWSTPQKVKIQVTEASAIVEKDVLIFAGGYDTVHDTGIQTSDIGNAVYIVDANTGDRLWWASNSASGAAVQVPGMDYSIPSDIKVADINGDGNADRMYVGDLGGNVWRIDLLPTLQNDASGGAIVHKLASLGHAADNVTASEARRFMYQPQITGFINEETAGGDSFIAVVLNSGNRAEPTDSTIHDRVYMLRDEHMTELLDSNNDGVADGVSTIVNGDLYDAYLDVYETADTAVLEASRGWYFDFKNGTNFVGEKGISRGLISRTDDEVKYLFSSYLPATAISNAATCSATTGGSRNYLINLSNATIDVPQCTNPAGCSTPTPPACDINPRLCEEGGSPNPPAIPGPPPPAPVPVTPSVTASGVCEDSNTTAIIGISGNIEMAGPACYYSSYWIKN